MDKKILTIIGARPHFVKAVCISEEIENSENLNEVVVHTGQHYDYELSQSFFEELNLPLPKYNLEVGSKSPLGQLGQIIMNLEEIIISESPDLIIVYGDTNSTAAGAIAGAKLNIPVAHVEAGLREFDNSIPEETNKLIIDSITDLYFAPTSTAVKNLENEGKKENVFLVGDLGVDLIANKIDNIYEFDYLKDKYQIDIGNYFFLTCHRQLNTICAVNLEEILSSLIKLEKKIIFSLHPRTSKAIESFGFSHYLEPEHIIPVGPLSFWETQSLIKFAKMVLTDSGGIIKESYFHKVPAIILDNQTEWVETVASKWHTIAGPNCENILNGINSFQMPNTHEAIFGDGTTAVQIVNQIRKFLDA